MDPNGIAEIANCNPTVLYYTYSTIAQTLAAAFAFVGAFVLFYIQSVNQNCERISDNIINTHESMHHKTQGYKLELKQSLLEEGWGSYRERFETFIIGPKLREKINQYRQTYGVSPSQDDIKEFKEDTEKVLRVSYTKDYSPIEIENLWKARCNLVKGFKWLAAFIAGTIVASLVLLPLSDILCSCYWLFYLPLF